MVATVERHHDLVNRYIISISLMTTDMFYGRHHDLLNRYIIYISLMTTDMFYGSFHHLTYPWSLVRYTLCND
jgi:hypothetical protein